MRMCRWETARCTSSHVIQFLPMGYLSLSCWYRTSLMYEHIVLFSTDTIPPSAPSLG